jgi:hypothetical protein
MAHWNYRLVRHRNSNDTEEPTYTTVHEVFYGDDGGVQLLAFSEASPRTKEEAEWIVKAFDEPVVAWVDDATITHDIHECGCPDYTSWGWMPDVVVSESEGW